MKKVIAMRIYFHWKAHFVLSILLALIAIAVSYNVTTYEFILLGWRFVERRHPALDLIGTRAFTSAGILGDPLNIAFIGSEETLHRQLLKAGCFPADPITLKSSLLILRDSLFDEPHPDAPVSDLFEDGNRQSFAFE